MRRNNVWLALGMLVGLLACGACRWTAGASHPSTAAPPALSGVVEHGVRTIHVTAQRYRYVPDPLVVKAGEKVRLLATSADVHHGLAIDAFKVNLTLTPGATQAVEFVASQAGTFEMYCTVYCGLGHPHMKGKLIVEP